MPDIDRRKLGFIQPDRSATLFWLSPQHCDLITRPGERQIMFSPIKSWKCFCAAALAPAIFSATLLADDLPAYPRPVAENSDPWIVVHVVDVRTVVAQHGGDELELVLAGIALPPDGPNRTLARDALARMALGESVLVEPGNASAPKGKTAYLYRAPDGLLINLELVRQGYTRARGQQPEALEAAFRHYEEIARRYEKGVWGPPPSQPSARETRAAPAEPHRQTEVDDASEEPGETVTVYVTRTGTKYHRRDCPHARTSGRPMALHEAKKTLEPCSRCDPPR
jgi:endonuclease YncB( thermonuclease family)